MLCFAEMVDSVQSRLSVLTAPEAAVLSRVNGWPTVCVCVCVRVCVCVGGGGVGRVHACTTACPCCHENSHKACPTAAP